MKIYGMALIALLVCGAVWGEQDATLSQAEVRDPRRLETYLETNATDAESRLAAAEGATNALTVRMTAAEGATNALNVRLAAAEGATNALDVAVTALQGATNTLNAAKANKADVFGTPVIASEYAAGVLISTNVITLKNGAGDTTTDYAVARVWLATSANAVSHDGTEIQKVTDKQDYWVVVTNAGTVTFVITEAATTTNTLSVSVGPNIDTETIPLTD
jgi:hypothetical protein